ncbi:MAG TPA: hypothetical protein DC047_11320 [Blastocatellia bacterium]|nr:hypothetical protein [Blastocatellia bacterium]
MNCKLLARFGADACIRKAKFPLVTPVPENGRLKSGYYCRLSGELSNGAQKSDRFAALPRSVRKAYGFPLLKNIMRLCLRGAASFINTSFGKAKPFRTEGGQAAAQSTERFGFG